MLYEPPIGKKTGFSLPDGDGSNGVLIVAEALGAEEEIEGKALVGKSGHFYFSELNRVGLERDKFTLFNVIACRPPDNKLIKMPWEHPAIKHCAPNLDKVIEHARQKAKDNGKTFTILTLGKTAFKRIMGWDEKHPIMHIAYQCYPHWNQQYGAWVVASDHPAYLVRGSTHLVPVMVFAAQRAVEIAANGVTPDTSVYLEDPPPAQFAQWVMDYEKAFEADPLNVYLSYDIETPMKQGKDEEEVSKEDDDDYTILRCSFSYAPGRACSVPWDAKYFPYFERLFGRQGAKIGWNNEGYDAPRVKAQVALNGDQIDGMLAWHVLNSSLPKGLGFVTPFYVHNASVWKHESNNRPAWYNCRDADYTLQIFLGVMKDLRDAGLWEDVFKRHVIETGRVLSYMSDQGVLRDEVKRNEAEVKLAGLLEEVNHKIEAVIPIEARKLKVYKKTPKSIKELYEANDTNDETLRDRIGKELGYIETRGTQRISSCPNCGLNGVKASHFKSIGKTKLKTGSENPCWGHKSVKLEVQTSLWALPLEFKISNVSLQRYQKVVKHMPIFDPKTKSITFDEKAIARLIKQYKKDPLYPLILEFREIQKLLGTYVGVTQESGWVKGGMQIGSDGRIHAQFTLNPSTLRTACQQPNLQNLPRPSKNPEDLQNLIRNLIVAPKGSILYARDFSGIEALLVGYEARAPQYMRLAKRDVHSFYTAWALHELEPNRISYNDLPQLAWDDDRLFTRLGEIKKEFSFERNQLYKHLVHGANFMQGPKGAAEKIFAETGVEYETKLVGKVMGVYFELFPEIKKWHSEVLYQADRDGYLRNAFGYIHRFSRVYDWEKIGGKWQKSPGPAANMVVAFKPQSTAAGIIKEAMLRLYNNRFEEAGKYLRLLIHDELLFEVPENELERVDSVVKEEMETPIRNLALPASYGMGEYLVVETEEKKGYVWGEMK